LKDLNLLSSKGSWMSDRLPLLSGLVVLELGDSVTAASPGALLAALGADVFADVSTGTPSTSGLNGGRRGTREDLLSVLRHDTRPLSELAPTVELAVAKADIVICDCDSVLPVPVGGISLSQHCAVVAGLNRSVWVSIAAFGLTGPRAGLRSSELCSLAAGGFQATAPSGRPIKLGGHQAGLIVGEMAALAALHGMVLFRAAGEPVHLEISAQEALISTGPFLHCAQVLLGGNANDVQGYGTPAGVFRCTDGAVQIYVMEERHWTGLVQAMGEPEWCRTYETKSARSEAAPAIAERVAQWTAELTRADCIASLQANGVPSASVNTPLDVLASEQLACRDFWVTAEKPELAGLRLPGFPALTPSGWSDRPPTEPRPVRVLDVTSVLGPPMSTAWLGAIGFDVVKVEDTNRIDIYRRFGPFADDVPGVDRGIFFTVCNFAKRSVALDLLSEDDRSILRQLVTWADIVVENQSESYLRKIGVMEQLEGGASTNTWVSSSGYGRSGPLASHRAYGQNIFGYCGLLAMSPDDEGKPLHLHTAWADMLSAIAVASTVTALALSRLRVRRFDFSMTEIATRHIGEFLVQAQHQGTDPEPELGNAMAPYAPHGVYRCSGENRWLAVSVESEDDWTSLLATLDDDRLRRNEWSTAALRLEDRTRLDATIEQILSSRDADELFEALQKAGVAAVPAWGHEDLVRDPHLTARQFFVPTEHAELGSIRLPALPWRRAGRGPFALTASPTLGNTDPSALLKEPTRALSPTGVEAS
jgi:crotonobetainyl-CoA:carnitine CoA-transferase CaiB-like acyl-CoA transferase